MSVPEFLNLIGQLVTALVGWWTQLIKFIADMPTIFSITFYLGLAFIAIKLLKKFFQILGLRQI